MAEAMRPDQRLLEMEFQSPRFELGVMRRQWRVLEYCWPVAFIAIVAKDGREFAFRFECSGYPNNRPAVAIWDCASGFGLAADRRPMMIGAHELVFRADWQGMQHLYHPMEREAFGTHGGWSTEHRYKLWNPERGLTQFLEELHRILNSAGYQVPQPDAA